jgi:hypothetical protein
VTFKTSQPAPKPGSAPKGRSSLSGDPRKKQKAIDRAIAKAEATKRRQSAKAAEKRDLQRAILAELKRRKLPTGQPVKPKREGPPRKGRERDEKYLAWIRKLPCLLDHRPAWFGVSGGMAAHLCTGKVEAHHVKTRGAGGSDRQAVPICALAHRQFHDWGRATFAKRYIIDLAHAARDLEAAYLQGAP